MLDPTQQQRSSAELRTALASSGLDPEQVAADLGLSTDQLHAALDVVEAQDPVHVWLLRDYLVQEAVDSGRERAAFTVLTDGARRQALMWFALRQAPRCSLT